MPASLDTTKRATVDIGEGHQVTVTVPHIEGSGTANTVFKGSKKPYQKECVLIIDHKSGEITLEKLSYNVQLKKTRAEGSSRIRANTPIDGNFNNKKSPPTHKLSPQQKLHSTFGRSSPIQKCSPLPKSPLSNQPSPNSSTIPSMPCLNLASSKQSAVLEPLGAHVSNDEVADAPEIGVLSSSSSSESSSSEESSDSSSSDNEEMAEVPAQQQQNIMNGFGDSPSAKEVPNNAQTSNHFSMPSANSLSSMPKFSQLSEDLRLSESDSDSDG
ncbi:ELL-associated factor 1-like [Stegodyphus dumicola]|uniref:ELL-associated factor 1-like n=1 Tax=Stegodyphus dumicola TaxID=202533 RepID=UPI0015AF3008|nr:ELL-associated factor 1-like [Stegodyphus dumicola]